MLDELGVVASSYPIETRQRSAFQPKRAGHRILDYSAGDLDFKQERAKAMRPVEAGRLHVVLVGHARRDFLWYPH